MSFKEKLKDFVKKYHYTKKEINNNFYTKEEVTEVVSTTISNINTQNIGRATELQNLINNNTIISLEKDYIITSSIFITEDKNIIGNGHTIYIEGLDHYIEIDNPQNIPKCTIQDLVIKKDKTAKPPEPAITCGDCKLLLNNIKFSTKYESIVISTNGNSNNLVSINNCFFEKNSRLLITSNTQTIISNCNFINTDTDTYLIEDYGYTPKVKIINCNFINNSTSTETFYNTNNSETNPIIKNCTFININTPSWLSEEDNIIINQ